MTPLTVSPPFTELDADMVADFRQWGQRWTASAVPVPNLDFSAVEYLGAAAISVLLEIDHALSARGVRLHIINARPIVERVLTICDLHTRWLESPPNVTDVVALQPARSRSIGLRPGNGKDVVT